MKRFDVYLGANDTRKFYADEMKLHPSGALEFLNYPAFPSGFTRRVALLGPLGWLAAGEVKE